MACWILYAGHFATNIGREHYPAFSLAERGTLRVDPYVGLHDDIFVLEDRGAFINNNPGASILGAVPYLLTRPLVDAIVEHVSAWRAACNVCPTKDYNHPRADYREYFRVVRQQGLDVRFGLAAGAMTALLMAPLSALSILVMWAVLRRMAFRERSLWPLVLLYGFGTPVFFRTAFLNQNLLVAQFSFFSFALLFGSEGAPPTSARAGAAGFLAGLALLCDYSALVAVPLIGIYCLYRCVRGARADPQDAVGSSSWAMTASLHDVVPVAAMAAAAAIPVGVLLAYQAWAFGNPIWPAQRYIPPAEYGAEGWYGFAGLDPELLYANLFDLRFGLVPAAPLLLLALAAPLVLRSVGAPELALTVSVFLGFWLLGSATQFARLQWETGVRYLVPVVPFVFLPTAVVVVCLPRLVRGAVTALAVLQSWALAMVREDPITSVRTVLADGPQLPWLKTLERTGDQYGSVAAVLAANPAIMAVAVAVVPVALLWLALRPMRRA